MDRAKHTLNRPETNSSLSLKICVIGTLVCSFCICTIPISLRGKISASLDLATTVDKQLFFVCLSVRQEDTLVVICSQRLYCLFGITVQSSSVPFKTALCRKLGLARLVASSKIRFTVLSVSGNADYTENNRRILVRSHKRACKRVVPRKFV